MRFSERTPPSGQLRNGQGTTCRYFAPTSIRGANVHMTFRLCAGAILLAASLVSACNRSKLPPSDSGIGQSNPGGRKFVAGPPTKAQLEAAAVYALDPIRFVQMANPPVTISPNRECVDDTSHDHSKACLLELSLLDAGTTFDPQKPLAHPIAVALIRNISTSGRTEAYLQLPPNQTYAWVVMPGTNPDSLLSGFVNIKDYSDWRPLRGMQRLKVCHGAAHGTEKVAFYCCNGKCPSDSAIHGDTTAQKVMAMGVARGEHTSPPWFSCALGCCYADF